MPSYIVKVNKEDDFYVYWSDIVEAPHCWGTRDEVAGYMRHIGHGEDLDARFERAAMRGTSSFPGFYDWDDAGFIFQQRGFLRREKLGEFLNSFDANEDTFDLTLLEPFEDEWEIDCICNSAPGEDEIHSPACAFHNTNGRNR